MATGDERGRIKVWSASRGREFLEEETWPWVAAYSPDGRWIVSAPVLKGWVLRSSQSGRVHLRVRSANGNAHHWIKFNLIGTASNWSAIGAKVRVKAAIGGKTFWQMREISGGQLGQDDPRPNFGLGDATIAELVRVEWPSGLVQEFQNVAADQILKITEHQSGPPPAPTLTASRSAEGAVQLKLTGDKNFLYVFEGSTDLVKWMKLGVRTNLTGTVEFTDTFAANYPHRFYRGVAP